MRARARVRLPRSDPQREAWIADTLGFIRGELRRVWIPNPAYLTPGEPIGEWVTVKVAGKKAKR